jgi:hypothetical protein
MKMPPKTKNKERAFWAQQQNAKYRGVPFLLTFEQWWDIWKKSGHWHERGRGKNKYCMARFGDKGAYEVGNVKIITNSQNSSEIVVPEEKKEKLSIMFAGSNGPFYGRTHTKEAKRKIGAATATDNVAGTPKKIRRRYCQYHGCSGRTMWDQKSVI